MVNVKTHRKLAKARLQCRYFGGVPYVLEQELLLELVAKFIFPQIVATEAHVSEKVELLQKEQLLLPTDL